MPNLLYQPYGNPIRFYKIAPTVIPQYIDKHMDDYPFVLTLEDHEEQVIWKQPFLTIDPVRLQMVSNFGPLTLKMIRCSDGAIMSTTNFDNLYENAFMPGFFIRQIDLDLATFPAGIYYFTLNDVYYSNPIETRVNWLGTIAIEYEHHRKKMGLYFGAPANAFKPFVRVPGRLKYEDTGSDDIIYEDDPLNETMIESKTFTLYDLYIGNSGPGDIIAGVPPYFMKYVKNIIGCSNLKINGRLYTKQKEANWENYVEDGSLLIGGKIQMRDKLNRESIIYEDETLIMGVAAAGLITDTKGFGMSDESGDDYLEIASTQ